MVLSQESSIVRRTSFSIIQNCQQIPGFMFLLLPSLVSHTRVFILDLEMVRCYICSLSPSQRTGWEKYPLCCSFMAMPAIWVTGICYFYISLIYYYLMLFYIISVFSGIYISKRGIIWFNLIYSVILSQYFISMCNIFSVRYIFL